MQYLTTGEDAAINYGMTVSECFLRGKTGLDDSCEDGVFCGTRFAAVVDSVTSKGKRRYKGKTSGRYAMEVILDTFAQLDHAKEKDTKKPSQILSKLDAALKNVHSEYSDLEDEDYLRASVVFFDRLNKIVSYGDCKYRIGDTVHDEVKKIDKELAKKRS